LLTPGNVLTWNVWVDAPTIVDQAEWCAHAEKWRHSIDTGHVPPDGPASPKRYFDGTHFNPIEAIVEEEWELIKAWLKKHIGRVSGLGV
jgi:hypothetical protein